MRYVKRITYPDGSVTVIETDTIDIAEIDEVVRSKVQEFWGYPPFRDTVAVDTGSSGEVNTTDWSTLKSYKYTAKRELRVFELRVRAGIKVRNTGSSVESVELSALVNNETIVLLGSITVDANSTLEDFIDVTTAVDVATSSKDIVVELKGRTSSETCYVSLTPPILVEIGYLMSPRQKYRRVGERLAIIPESILEEMERGELERRITESVLKKLEGEYEIELQIDMKTGTAKGKIRKRS
jgi:hypothetical protein